jgi:thimet oligopeptidase
MKIRLLPVAFAAIAALGLIAVPADAARKRVVRPAARAKAKPHAAAPTLAASSATVNPNSPLPGPAFPSFDNATQVASACTTGLEGASEREKMLENRKPGLDWLRGWDDLYGWQEDHSGALIFLQNVHPNAEIRSAAEACELRWQDFQSTLGLNEKIYLIGKKSVLTDPIDKRALQVALEGFEDSGVALPLASRARAKELSDQITALSQQFNKNIRDSHVRVSFTEAELKGVPDGVWKDKPRDADGKVILGVDYPTYYPVLQNAEDSGARERMWRAKMNEGGADNLKVLWQIEKLRLEYAKLFGYPSYADFLLRHRMAENTARVTKFLDDVHAAVADEERRDIANLRDAKARYLGKSPDSVKVTRWDTLFYSERLKREKFAIDDETFRPYFPPQESLRFVMRIAEKLFNIRYDRVDGTYWAPDVQAYAVTDLATGKKIASLYVDLYPRDGKYNHAAVWSYRNAATGVNRQAQAALVVNFDRKGLTLQELETLLHEFGHSLHSNLSATRYASDGGTNVEQDFVEAPSQMLEDWVYDKKVLKVFQEVCPTCKPVPDDLVDKARAAKDFGKGLQVARQHLYASYDLALHGTTAPDPMDTWARMEGATPLGYVPGTMFPAGFAHIAGGYGAGYYGYLWSLVVAMDMRTAFAADKLDPKVGARYRADVIGQGGQKLPQQLVKDFLGRDMSTQAFFDYLKK